MSIIGSLINEIIKGATGVDLGGMASEIKSNAETASAEMKELKDNEEYYIEILGYDEYHEICEQVKYNFKNGIRDAILYNDKHYTDSKIVLAELSDAQMERIKKLYSEGKIPTNAKFAIEEELEYRNMI